MTSTMFLDFRNLNLADPRDEYPMPVADMLLDAMTRHKILFYGLLIRL